MNESPELPRRYLLFEANYRQLLDYRPNVAILPWGATEAHNYHLPHGTDVIEAGSVASEAARLAHERGAKPIVLPTVPFGNNAQQLDQVATIHCSTSTALAILRDVVLSLTRQGIDRLILLNGHGGNEFKPLVRDLQLEFPILIVVVNFWQVRSDESREIFQEPGEHAGDLETSLLLHLCPELVELPQAGEGVRVPFAIEEIADVGGWTPRPWSHVHPDTGDGSPAAATAEKGAAFLQLISAPLADLICGLSRAQPGQLPYLQRKNEP
jgi:creatinine amidohydrolase